MMMMTQLEVLLYFKPLIFISVAVCMNYLIPDHEASGVELLHQPAFTSFYSALLCQPFTRWDSVYFLNISTQGYLQEKELVFFPLYPYLLRFSAECIIRLGEVLGINLYECLNLQEICVVCGLILNYIFYILSLIVLRAIISRWIAERSSQDRFLFCYAFNPVRLLLLDSYYTKHFSVHLVIFFFLLRLNSIVGINIFHYTVHGAIVCPVILDWSLPHRR